MPASLTLAAERVQLLRYGENPHQQAALYRWAGAAPAFEQIQGKELSYNNLIDLEAAWAMPHEFAEPTVAIIKHTNPSGLASAANLLDAYRLAFACDPVSAFGSIIAVNREVDRALVEEIGSLFVEVLAAPAYTPDALGWLAEHKKNCRVMGRVGVVVTTSVVMRDKKRLKSSLRIVFCCDPSPAACWRRPRTTAAWMKAPGRSSRGANPPGRNGSPWPSPGWRPNTSNPTPSSWSRARPRWAWARDR